MEEGGQLSTSSSVAIEKLLHEEEFIDSLMLVERKVDNRWRAGVELVISTTQMQTNKRQLAPGKTKDYSEKEK